MKVDVSFRGVDSCGPDPEEVFREALLARLASLEVTLVRIAIALETGPHVPARMILRVGVPTKE